MGLADIVFPCFLFAVGMSIPYAIERRYAKGFSAESTLGHILSRTFALLVMALVQQAYDKGCWLCAICAAPTILAHMGLLDRRKAVCYPGLEDGMGSAVVKKGERVVADGRIITGEAAGSAFAFGLTSS